MKDNSQLLIIIFNTQQRRITNFISSRVQSKHDSEDICQEVFAIAVKNIGTLRDNRKIVPWLFGITANVIKRYYKDKNKTYSGELLEPSFTDRSETITELRLILDKLPAKLKLTYKLYYERNRKIREIAQLQNLPEGTVKYYLFELRKRIKKEYAEMSGKEEAI